MSLHVVGGHRSVICEALFDAGVFDIDIFMKAQVGRTLQSASFMLNVSAFRQIPVRLSLKVHQGTDAVLPYEVNPFMSNYKLTVDPHVAVLEMLTVFDMSQNF